MGESGSVALGAEKSYKDRNSNIELLKIVAILLIMIQHWSQTLATPDNVFEQILFGIDDFIPTFPKSAFFVNLFQSFGNIGNYVFFICTAWFLIDSDKRYGKKIFSLMTDVWLVSVLLLACALVLRRLDVSKALIVKSLFPTTFSNNWYITQYILFLAVFPYLNAVLAVLPQKKHLLVILFLLTVKLLINAFITANKGIRLGNLLTGNWVELYFAVAYMKKYLPQSSKSIAKNLFLLAIGSFMYIVPIATYVFKLNCHTALGKLYYEWINSTAKYALIALALFNLFRRIEIKSTLINKISSLSLLIYIIHENLIVRYYYRPLVCRYFCGHFGYEHITLFILIMALLTLLISIFAALIYEKTFGRLSKKLAEFLYPIISSLGRKVIGKLAEIR